ncbi:MAG: Hydrogenase isoenzymes nickel incorporation protein HypB [Deltaproteobacteria bacterium ADurb.BinA179]|jgi:hydrogenase nickel incorporation protein HypB|nr:hydrogenase nickel incorporation protein HypB [Deltaproteobacteria bacterium]MDI9542205.1 hydrogenase nickel incorporation protein HypB [Pseudomonadota bacterium]OPZ29137.1 MAG: Hydrogenase isoenzymes nickel incorporation protein HypB [Deltaproteobacteria bacterium ADurb.BinA179]HRR69643.1 hydrogenase nickel incorporation protein HypB [Desulfomonilia bacterium]HOD70473.1 hydrogenase nickel incorporation protein HypB [Deltaproteobacteria bacterium]
MGDIRLIEIREDILSDNRELASELRARLARHKTYLLNLMSSPGSGKTSLILRTVDRLKDRFRIGVLEADIDSIVDAERVAASGVQAVQLRTGGFCHLDAGMVAAGLEAFDLDALDLVIIENVGNLVCPAEFDTGAIRNAMILSVPEGDDKPLKYPLMFSVSDVLLVNKTDFLSLSDFDMQKLKERVYKLNSGIAVIPVSCRTGEGIDAWAQWLSFEVSGFIGR